MKLRKFSKPKFLEQIGRGLLTRLLARFEADFTTHGIAPPAVGLDDEAYYGGLAKMAVAPQGLPETFIEALYGIESMASTEGKARLMQAVETANVPIERIQEATHADFATQVLLAAPELFAQKQDEAQVVKLSSFEYFGTNDLNAVSRLWNAEENTSSGLRPPSPQRGEGQRGRFTVPDEAAVGRIKADIDAWLAAEHEGDERVR